MVMHGGLIGTVGSIWLNNNFTAFLTFLNSMLPPVGGIIIADYFFIKKRKYDNMDNTKFKNINWIAIVAFLSRIYSGKCCNGRSYSIKCNFNNNDSLRNRNKNN